MMRMMMLISLVGRMMKMNLFKSYVQRASDIKDSIDKLKEDIAVEEDALGQKLAGLHLTKGALKAYLQDRV